MDNLAIYNKYAEVPTGAQKTIKGGRLNNMTDINPMWRIKCLTEQFGICGVGWVPEIVRQWTEDGADGVKAAYATITLRVKVDGEWSEPIFGTGGSMFVAKEKGGLYTSDECYKMAYTDALSVCCKMLGFGANVYWQKGETKYAGNDDDPLGDAPICAYCAKPIVGGQFGKNYYSAGQIAAKSKARHGVALHPDCAVDYAKLQEGKNE